jgi:CelD/BcsL family acetyltransferase involved in cellulose biosynthesis
VEPRVIEDVASLSALAEAWRGLQPSIRHPFQELGWYTACARTVGLTGGRRLKCATLWADDHLIAVLPLALRLYKGVRLLEWMGSRVTDYCDAIVAPGVDAQEALRLLWQSLRREVSFDVLRLGHVRIDGLMSRFVDPLDHWVETRESALTIALSSPSGADWLATRTSHARRRTRQRMRYMDKHGFEFEVWRTPEKEILDAAIELKEAWIKARNVDSVISGPQGPEFVRVIAEEMAAHGMLHLSAVRSAKQQIVACHVGFVRGDTFYYYLPAYDSAFAKQSFGTTLRELLIMWACDQGLKKFDLLLGAHDYKLRYGALEEKPIRTLVVPRSLLGRAAVAYYRRASANRGSTGGRRTH